MGTDLKTQCSPEGPAEARGRAGPGTAAGTAAGSSARGLALAALALSLALGAGGRPAPLGAQSGGAGGLGSSPAAEAPRWQARPEFALLPPADQPDGALQGEDLIRAAWLASGLSLDPVSGAGAEGPRARLEPWLVRARQIAAEEADLARRADRLLQAMHDEGALRRYAEPQTRLHTLVETGVYNCVSATMLYIVLGRAAGLNVSAVATRTHAFARVDLPEGPVDVETTVRLGYDPGRRREFQNEFGAVTGFAYVPRTNTRDRRDISARELFGLAIQNRLVELQQARRAWEEPGLAFDRLALEGSGARPLALEAVGNLISRRNSQRDFLRALGEVEEAESRLGPDPVLARLRRTLVHNLVSTHLAGGRLDAAEELLIRWQGLDGLDTGPLFESLDGQRLNQFGRARDWAGGLAAYEALPEARRQRSALRRLADTFLRNATAEVFNAMAAALNAGQIDQARALLEAGEARWPDHPVLRDARRQFEAALRRQS